MGIQAREPDWDRLPCDTPNGVRNLLQRCLQKDADLRLRDIGEVPSAIKCCLVCRAGVWPMIAGPAADPPKPLRSPEKPARLPWPWPRRLIIAMSLLALAAIAVVAARSLWRTPRQESWSGTLLGGPESAMAPRVSPDGSLMAFQAFVGEITQVAVMKPETGNWTVLTHNSRRGYVNEIAWSPDGTRLYYDRVTGVPNGVFTVPVLGGEERLLLEDAMAPQKLPDGSLLVLRLNAERKQQVFRFWPETGQLRPFPVEAGGNVPQVRVFPDGREAVVQGNYLDPGQPAGKHVFVLDLASGGVRDLTIGPATLAVTRDGKSILAAISSGDLTQVQSFPRTGAASPRTLFTTTSLVRYMDTGPDGSVYADQVSRPTSLVHFASSGGNVDRQSGSASYLYMEGAALLPNGRFAMTVVRQGRRRLMVIEAGRDPVPLANTAEDTATPATAVGLSEVAFMVVAPKPKPHREVAIASVLTGRILRRVAFDKGEITSLAATPDGKMLYCAANGIIWSIPSTGGEPRKIRAGDSVAVDPEGKYLLVQLIENPATRLVRVQLDSGAEQEIRQKGPLQLT